MRKNTYFRSAGKAVLFSLSIAGALALTGCSSPSTPPSSSATTAAPQGTEADTQTVPLPSTQGSDDTEADRTTDAAPSGSEETTPEVPAEAEEYTDTLSENISVKFSSYEQNLNWEEKKDASITFSESSAVGTGKGFETDGTVVTIYKKGTYEFTGSCKNGQIVVSVPDEDKVRLVMNGLDLTCEDSCPIFVESASKVVLLMADGTENSFEDSAEYTKEGANLDKANACIFSCTDLIINGSGTLNVKANYNNGIGSKDDIKVLGTSVRIDAVKNGIKGNDSITLADKADITINSGNDGLKSDQEGSPSKGFIYIKSGVTCNITCTDDALQAFNAVVVQSGASVTASAGGKTTNCDGTVEIADGTVQ